MENIDRTILHCDANNFYASVECKLNPTLKDKCVAVCGDPEQRHGIVLAKNQAAKAYNVKTGDTIWQAKLKCPDLVVVKPQYDKYVDYSNALFDIYTRHTDKVEPFGMDECWLDLTQFKNFGSGIEIANKLRESVKKELGITISCGVSFNKIFAKLGSDLKKPDATTVILKDNFKQQIFSLPVSDLLMVGRQTLKTLNKLNIHTIGELANFDKDLLQLHFGINGIKLYEYANGLDNSPVKFASEQSIPKSISNSVTTYRDLTTKADLSCVIRSISELLSTRLLRYNLLATGLHLSLKSNNFNHIEKQVTILPTSAPLALFNNAMLILNKTQNLPPIRSVGITVFNFANTETIQLSLFNPNFDKQQNLANSVDSIKKKYGYKYIAPASTFFNQDLCSNISLSDYKPFKH